VTLLESLLDAIVRLEGDALVMHVGEKPYVVTTSSSMNAYRGPLAWGQVELSSRVLTSEAVLSMVGQILPPDQRQALDDLGAVEHEIAPPGGVTDRFTVVAARGGDDIWLELRRHPMPVVRPQPATVEAPAAAAEAGTPAFLESGVAVGLQETLREESLPASLYEQTGGRDTPAVDEPPMGATTLEETTIEERVPVLDEVGADSPERVEHITIPVNGQGDEEESVLEVVDPEAQHAPTDADVDALLAATAGALLTGGAEGPDDASEPREDEWTILENEAPPEHAGPDVFEPSGRADAVESGPEDLSAELDEMPGSEWSPELSDSLPPPIPTTEEPPAVYESHTAAEPGVADDVRGVEEQPAAPAESPPSVVEVPLMPAAYAGPEVAGAQAAGEQSSSTPETHVDHSAALPKPRPEYSETTHAPGVVLPMSRSGVRPEKPAAGGRVDDQMLLQMLRVAAERAASTVYVVAQSRPMIRVDGEISALDSEPVFSADDIERLTVSLAPRRPDAAAPDAPIEWISEVPEVGRVRCVTFRDHRGPGLIFRMISARSISADHLNLSPEIRDLAAHADGLVLVTGARGTGKSTLLSSFVDLINRTRSDHVITIETEIGYVHESRRSFISQREVHNDPAAAGAAAHAALKEDPDVLVIEDLHTPESVSAALSAAESGRLVFASITAPSSIAALETIVEMFPAGQRAGVRATLSRTLRAVVAQVLLRKAAGGRVTARELLLNSPAVASSIREGKPSEAAAALEAGQRQGMVSMNDSLTGLVRGGTVHSAEAYRRAPDRTALLARLAREGVDTSFAERLA
jgi:twitching motility protein PilT